MKLDEIYMRDPFMFVEDGVCYLIGTTDKQCFGGEPASGFLGYKSNDLVNFEGPYTLFENTPDFWAEEQFWAPEMHKIDGKYFIFATFFKAGLKRACQMLVSDTPFGKYKPYSEPFTPKDMQCLDATFLEENGKKYTIFCHEWLQINDGAMVASEFSDDMKKIISKKILFNASEAKWTQYFFDRTTIKNYVTDGPFIYKTKQGRLLMLWSSNGKEGYALGISYSDNGIFGDWKHFEKPLFSKDGGHGMVFEFNDKLYLILHTSNKDRLQERPCLIELEEKNNNLVIKE